MIMPGETARRPDFLIIGAPKCGTTWLNRRLALHPGIHMPLDEVHFFSRHFDRGWDWYATHFAGAAPGQIIGENSNSYLTEAGAFERIRAEAPEARIVCILRHPVERAYSSYGMQIDRGRANRDIDAYLDPLRSPRPHILSNGLYARMLEPWFDAFGAARIHIALFDDIAADPAGLYARLTAFLGVASDFIPDNLRQRENARKQSGVPGPVKRALWWLRPQLESGALRGLRHGALGRRVEALLTRPKSYPALPSAIAARLHDYYAGDIERLEQLSGRSLKSWRLRYAPERGEAARDG